MSDPFALLDLPRRPWLEDNVVRTAFQRAARRLHPDMPGGDAEKFAELNAAQSALADPGTRLRLLAGDAPVPHMPPDVSLGFLIAKTAREVENWKARVQAAPHALARALLAGEAAPLSGKIRQAMHALDREAGAFDERLREADRRWPSVAPEDLAALAGEAVFLGRWRAQLREQALAMEVVRGGRM